MLFQKKNIKDKALDNEKIIKKAKKYLKKYSLKDTVNMILETEKLKKKVVYEICLQIKNQKNY